MLLDSHALEWMIPGKGMLTWIDEPERSYLVVDFDQTGMWRTYYPAENPTLFHRFATTEVTKEGIMAFAQTYGVLGVGVERWEDNWKIMEKSDRLDWEYYSKWKGEIEELRIAYAFWRALKKDDEAALHATFSLRRGRFRRLDIRLNAWHHIDVITTEAFERYPYAIRPSFDLANQAHHTGLSIKFAPSTLIVLIWLQFVQVVSASDRWQICEYCSEPFKPESMKARYCSDSHRQMAYRKRKQSKE